MFVTLKVQPGYMGWMLDTFNVQPVFVGWMFGDVGYTQSPACVCGLDVWRCLSHSTSSLCLWVECLEMLNTVKVQPVFVGWMFGDVCHTQSPAWVYGLDVRHIQCPACVCGLDVWRCLSHSKSSLCLWVGCLEMLDTVKVQPVFVGWMFGDVCHTQSPAWVYGLDVRHIQCPACVCGLDVWRCWLHSKSSLCLWVGCLEMFVTLNVQPVFVG